MSKIKIASLSDLPPGKMKEYRIAGKVIALANCEGEIKAFDGFHASASQSKLKFPRFKIEV